MSSSVNLVHLLGVAGKDPEIRATNSGTIIANVSLATDESYKDNSGQWQKSTEWHNIKAFGRSAETIRDHVRKGSKLFIEGKLKTESWEDKQTSQKKYKTVIVAVYASVVPTVRSTAAKEPIAGAYDQRPPAGGDEQLLKSAEISDDDIPF